MNEDIIVLTDAVVLIVDDDPNNINVLRSALEPEGYQIAVAMSGEMALKVAAQTQPSLILLDVLMPKMNGFEACRCLQENSSTAHIPVIFITAKTEKDSLVSGFQAGGVDYITKPFETEEVLVRVATHLKIHKLTQKLLEKNRALEQEMATRKQAEAARDEAESARQTANEQLSLISEQEAKRWGIAGFVGKSETMAKIMTDIRRLHQVGTTSVLITGESGTGKELIARAIHYGGLRAKGPFIAINCSTISKELAESALFGHVRGAFTGANTEKKGYFELADSGTLFLDEVGEMPLDLQVKFLRVLEDGSFIPVGGTKEKQIDVRILAATNVDFHTRIATGGFRDDLYFRLARFTVKAPPLRDRREDIPLLAQHFLETFAQEMGIASKTRRTPNPEPCLSPEAMEALMNYSFPGNIRELKNIIERALIESGGEILPEHLHFLHEDGIVSTTRRSRFQSQAIEALTQETISTSTGYSQAVNDFQRRFVEQTLRECNWNRHRAARRLKMDRSNLIKLIRRLQIAIPEPDGGRHTTR